MIPSPYSSTEKVATGAPPDVVIVPLIATVGGVPVLVMTMLSPFHNVPLMFTATMSQLESNSTEPCTVVVPSVVPPVTVKGGALDKVSEPSVPFENVPLCVPAKVTSFEESMVMVPFCSTPMWPNDSLMLGMTTLTTCPELAAMVNTSPDCGAIVNWRPNSAVGLVELPMNRSLVSTAEKLPGAPVSAKLDLRVESTSPERL